LIQERTREELKAAKARGRCGGRKRKLSAAQIEVARLLFEKNLPVGEICETLGVSQATLYRTINGPRSEEAAKASGA